MKTINQYLMMKMINQYLMKRCPVNSFCKGWMKRMAMWQIIMPSVWLLLLLTACREQPEPDVLMPEVTVGEATEVTRHAARLQGQVTPHGGEVSYLAFCYGTSPQALVQQVEVDCSQGLQPSVTLTGLTAATTYYYCLQAGNGTSLVSSQLGQLTTMPNVQPTIQRLKLLNQGPLSITMQFEVTDDGGEPLTAVGFYLQAEGQSHEEQLLITPAAGIQYSLRITGLEMEQNYTLQPFAANAIGETRGERYPFATSEAVRLTEAGTLWQAIDASEVALFTSLSLAGPMNGSDLQWLRHLMGVDVNGAPTDGRLEALDMTDVILCAGGTHYDGQHYTYDHQIGTGMFAHVPYLTRVQLPATAVEIARDAFEGAHLLTAIEVPAAVEQVAPSRDCPNLRQLTVAPGNSHFTSVGDALYDASQRVLCWYPQGRAGQPEWSPLLEEIGPYACQQWPAATLSLPATLTKLGEGAFLQSALEEVVIPDKVSELPRSLFQSCSRLERVTLGEQVSVVGSYCFEGCPLRDLYIHSADFPPLCYAESFTDEQYRSCTLHVPSSVLMLYRNATYWGRFERIEAW